jgi:hypothetical protein
VNLFALRRACAFVIVTCPLAIVIACSQATNHPPIIGDCAGPNCVVGGGAAGIGTSGSGDGSTTDDDSSTTADDSGVDDSGSIGTGD